MITTKVNMVKHADISGDKSLTPKKPYMLVIRTPPNTTIIAAANNWPISFFIGAVISISSFIPIKKIIIKAPTK